MSSWKDSQVGQPFINSWLVLRYNVEQWKSAFQLKEQEHSCKSLQFTLLLVLSYTKKSTNHHFKWLDVDGLFSPLQSQRFMFCLQKSQKTTLAITDIAALFWLSIFFHFKYTYLNLWYYLWSMITGIIWEQNISLYIPE